MSDCCGDRLPVDHATLVCGRKAGHEGEHRCTRSDGSITAWGDVPLRPAADRAAMRYGGQVEPRVSVPAPLPPDPAATDATAGDGLREAIAGALAYWYPDSGTGQAHTDDEHLAATDAVLALPPFRDVLAAAARDAEKVRELEREVEKLKALIARNHIAYLRVQGIEP